MRYIAGAVLLALVVAVIPVTAQTRLDGVWKGKTSEDKDIAITVNDGAITSIKVNLSLKLDAPCRQAGNLYAPAINFRGGEAEATYPKPIAIAKGAFTATMWLLDFDADVSGKFSGEALKGEISLQAREPCSGKGKLTYSATR